VHSDFDKDADCNSSDKSGKSGGGGSSSKSGKSGGRMLVAPGTEEYVNGVGMGKSRKLTNELMREVQTDDTMVTYYDDSTGVDVVDSDGTDKDGTGSSSSSSSKSGKGGGSGSNKSGKSGGFSNSSCKPKTKDTCDSGLSSMGKSGKSGGGSGKSGKSGGSSSNSKDANYGDNTENDATGSSSRILQGQRLDAGGDEYGSLNEDKCCDTNFPNGPNSCQMYVKCPPPTPAPTPCIYEDQPWKFDMSPNQCVPGCEYLDIGSIEFGTLNEDKCCDTHFLDQDCIVDDKCPPPTPAPAPTPTPCICEDQPWKFDESKNQCVRGCEYLDVGAMSTVP